MLNFKFGRRSDVLRVRMEDAILQMRNAYEDLDVVRGLQESETLSLKAKLEDLKQKQLEFETELLLMEKMQQEASNVMKRMEAIYSKYEQNV